MLEQQATQKGMDVAQILLFGDNAGTRAAYNESYKVAASRHAVQDAKHIAQRNIAAIRQDKVLSNTAIRLRQDQAEAMALVQSAAAGVEGGSVDDVIYETERTASFATQASNRRHDQETESYLSAIGSQTKTLATIEDREYNYFQDLFVAAAEIGGIALDTDQGQRDTASQQWNEGMENLSGLASTFAEYFSG